MPRIQTVVIHDGPQGAPGATGATGSPGPALTPKGTQAAVGALPASGNTVGDLWLVTGTNHAYGWNGSAWIDLGPFAAQAWGSITGTLSAQTDLNTALGNVTPGDGQVIIGATTPIKANGPLNVKAKGAVGDGVTDDQAAFTTAMTAAGASGRQIRVPTGTYKANTNIVIRAGTIHLKGDGSPSTVMTMGTAIAFLGSNSYNVDRLLVEDMTFDLGGSTSNSPMWSLSYSIGRAEFRNCEFINFAGDATNSPSAITFGKSDRLLVENCAFSSPGNHAGTALTVTGPAGDITFRNNRCHWLTSGVIVAGGSTPDGKDMVDRVVIEGNYFDGYWWLGKTTVANSGGTVTYTSTGLADTAANFATVPGIGNGTYKVSLRAMAARQTTSATAFGSFTNVITATDGLFVTNAVKRGEIIRTADGLKWATVRAVVSETELNIEGWYDSTTMKRVTAPASGTTITIYKLAIGTISTFTTTTLTLLTAWSDLDGAAATPAAGTAYEIMKPHPNYHLNVNPVARSVRVANNTFRRGWSDQCSVYSGNAQILGNTIEDGEDLGITLNSGVNDATPDGCSIIANNSIRHQGTSGIYCNALDTIVANNYIASAAWTNGNVKNVGIELNQRGHLRNNVIDGENKPNAVNGIKVNQWADNSSITDNRIQNVSGSHIALYPATNGTDDVTGLHVRGPHTINHVNGARTNPGGVYELRGAGSPAGVIVAGPGSEWRDTTNGALYVKQGTTTDASGWTLK